jgi:hypothetical protein
MLHAMVKPAGLTREEPSDRGVTPVGPRSDCVVKDSRPLAIGNKSLTLSARIKPTGLTADEFNAALTVEGLLHNAGLTVQFSEEPMGELALTECLEALTRAASDIQAGNLGRLEALLTGQIVALNAIFTRFALRSKVTMGQFLDASERHLRLGLKAQSQCRATAETLAALKNPTTVFARQANIANGPQQVNNSLSLARAEKLEIVPNELLEGHGERLDSRTSKATVGGDPNVAAVAALNRPKND